LSLKEQNYVYIVETILEKISGTKKNINLMVYITETVKVEYIRALFAYSNTKFKNITYKMMSSDGTTQR